ARYLRLAALDPEIELLLLPQHPLIQKTNALVAEPHRQRADPQMPPPRLAALGDHRLVGADDVVEMIQDHRALDQRLAAVQHQRRHPPQRIIGRDLVGIAEGRPRLVLEGDAIQPHGDGDAADEGGVVLADQDHVKITTLQGGRNRQCNGLSYSAKAGYPVRRSLAVLSPAALEYWIPGFAGMTTESKGALVFHSITGTCFATSRGA